jgi:superfamily II DNA helicase RecQ
MPRKKQTRRGKYTRSPSPIHVEPGLQEIRSKIAVSVKQSEQREVIAKAVELLYRFSPREQQLDCIQWLLYQKEDLVLVAKTSFGKSLIMQILPCLVPNSCIVVILPLLALGSEQSL